MRLPVGIAVGIYLADQICGCEVPTKIPSI
jgi:hypothetical protein